MTQAKYQKSKRIIIALSVIAVIVLGLTIYVYANAFAQAHEATVELKSTENRPLKAESAKKSQESPVLEKNTSPEATSSPVQQPVQQSTTTQPASTQTPVQTKSEGAHVPFTNQPVTPGDSQSYVGTVGQCPFYEMAGEKGCVPPPDIQCNDDWSVCTYVGDKQ